MPEKVSHDWRLLRPYVVKEADKTMTRRGLTAPATATTTPATPPGEWRFDDGSTFDSGKFFDP